MKKRAANTFTDFSIADSNYYASRDGATIDTVILHTTVCTLAQAIARFARDGTEVSAHWIVGLDGSWWRGVEEQFTAYHAGDWEINLRSIGIENVDDGAYDDPRPDSLYVGSGALLASIRARWPIATILDHRDVHATRCPDALDTARIRWLSGGAGMTFDPFNNPADLAKFDQRVRDLILGEPQLTASALKRALERSGYSVTAPVAPRGAYQRRRPDTHMKGTPPKGHPASAR